MSRFLRAALVNEWQTHFPRWTYLLQNMLTALIMVGVYYFTSRALGAQVNAESNWYGLTYFEFLMMGELGLALHLAALDGLSRAVRFGHVAGLLDDILTQEPSPYRRLSELAIALQLKEVLQWILIFIVAVVAFGFHIEPMRLLKVALLGLVSWPAFFFFGQILGTVVLVTGRGTGVIGQFLFLLSVLSGAYFPTDVYPMWLQQGLVDHIPTTKLLDQMRRLISTQVPASEWTSMLIYFLILGFTLFWAARAAVTMAIRRRLTRSAEWIMPLR